VPAIGEASKSAGRVAEMEDSHFIVFLRASIFVVICDSGKMGSFEEIRKKPSVTVGRTGKQQ